MAPDNLSAKRIAIENLKPGMVLARDVIDGRGDLVLKSNTVLNKEAFNAIIMNSSPYVFVLENSIVHDRLSFLEVSANEKSAPVDIPVAKRESFSRFAEEYEDKPRTLNNEFKRITEGAGISQEGLYAITDSVMGQLKTKNDAFQYMNTLKDSGEHIYTHSVNVSLIANLFGLWLNFSADEVSALTVAALVHDIGMTMVPQEILHKAGPLTNDEREQLRKHPTLGYRILQNAGMPNEVVMAALGHHERIDGSGYPLGLKSDKISKFAKILAICDVYAAMTANRAHRERMCPFDVIRSLERESFNSFDTEALLVFLKNIAYTYLNSDVILSDGAPGKVVFINADNLSCPMVKTVNDRVIDLRREKNLRIASLAQA